MTMWVHAVGSVLGYHSKGQLAVSSVLRSTKSLLGRLNKSLFLEGSQLLSPAALGECAWASIMTCWWQSSERKHMCLLEHLWNRRDYHQAALCGELKIQRVHPNRGLLSLPTSPLWELKLRIIIHVLWVPFHISWERYNGSWERKYGLMQDHYCSFWRILEFCKFLVWKP